MYATIRSLGNFSQEQNSTSNAVDEKPQPPNFHESFMKILRKHFLEKDAQEVFQLFQRVRFTFFIFLNKNITNMYSNSLCLIVIISFLIALFF